MKADAIELQHPPSDCSFSFIDFVPTCVKPSRCCSQPQYEPFDTLLPKANDWLRENPSWQAKSCESVEFREDKQENALGQGLRPVRCLRGLRLWIVPRSENSEGPQEIAYFTMAPEQLTKPLLGEPKFASLTELLNQVNSMLRSCILPGRILTVETLKVKMKPGHIIDTDNTFWMLLPDRSQLYLLTIRVFYEKGPPAYEEIGVADFPPTVHPGSSLFSSPQYELFSSVLVRVSRWLQSQQSIRYCNIQSLDIRSSHSKGVDSQKMAYQEGNPTFVEYTRILRVVFCKSFKPEAENSATLLPQNLLTCKCFEFPITRLACNSVKVEDLSSVKARVEAWIRATGARVLSAETVILRLLISQDSCETSYPYYCQQKLQWAYMFRIYIDGEVTDPPAHELPPVPTMQKSFFQLY